MLIPITTVRTPAVDRLIQAWSKLYVPNIDLLAFGTQSVPYSELVQSNSQEGRTRTFNQLKEPLIQLQSEIASIHTSELYAYMQTVMNLRELRQMAELSFQVYKHLLHLYQQDGLGTAWIIEQLQPNYNGSDVHTAQPQAREIVAFAQALEPLLLEFQQAHRRCQDWRTLGFLTTQFNFFNRFLLRKLTPSEKVLIRPYLQFVEEQSAHPWMRVCGAAASHAENGLEVTTVEQMIPLSPAIAEAAFNQIIKQCAMHQSRRGALANAEVTHSCIRDFKMFQAYLWLCLLEGDCTVVQKELLDLCVRVLPSVGVKWELISIWTQTLNAEILRRLPPVQREMVRPYATEMEQVFLRAKAQLDTEQSRSVGIML